MTMKVEYTILAALVGLIIAIVNVAFPDAPVTADALMALLLYVLAKLGVEVVGKPLLRRLFPKHFRAIRYTPPE